MAIFAALYNKVLEWAKHKHAPRYLAGLSFVESAVLPLPPDLMLVPMTLAQIDKAWYFAFITTLFSVLGGIVGYCLGYFFFELLEPTLIHSAYWQPYQQVMHWVHHKGIYLLLVAGLLPIPYKIFTIGSGALQVAFIPFLIASIIGRAVRFYLVSGVLVWKGERMHHFIVKYVEQIGWFLLASVIAGAIAVQLYRSLS